MYDLAELPEIKESVNELITVAIARPVVATILRRIFQEVEHMAYRRLAIEDKENG